MKAQIKPNCKKHPFGSRGKKALCRVLFSLTLFSFFSCSDEENNNIPLVEVNFSINIDNPEYLQLKNTGGWVEVTGGVRGIILYRSSTEEIKAYDRNCTFQPSNTCALVSVDLNNLTASDQCCGSSFSLINGSVTGPPATVPLKQYNTLFDGVTLRVFN